MKKLIVALLIILASFRPEAQTVFRLNQYNILYNGVVMPVFTLYASQQLSGQWGFAGYFYVNGTKGSSWGEGLAGPVWTPVKGLSLGFLAGIQSNEERLFRFSPILNFNRGKFSAFAAFEAGGLRHRWDVMAFYNKGRWKAGAELIRFYSMYAAGPRLELSCCNKVPLTAFVSGLWDWVNDKPALMVGLYATFTDRSPK